MARRRRSNHLLWALLISLLVNHGVLLPGVYFLLFDNAADAPDPVVAVELVEQPRETEEAQALPAPLSRALQQRAHRARPQARPPEPPKPKPKPKEQQKRQVEKEQEKVPEPPEPPDPTMRLKMVDVPNPETKEPPKEARFLSDKNRQVERETRARETNLVKAHPRPEPRSQPSLRRDDQPGQKQRRVAEQQERRAEKRRTPRQQQANPLTSMRRAHRPQAATPEREQQAEQAPDGALPAPSKRREARRLELSLDHESHDRVYGKEAVRQRELARLSPSASQGAHQQKWDRIRSSLENFTPEVQPGNQTALGTRAHPFALYVARMHRNIHRLWGFGFLVDLDNKPDSHEMNDMALWTMVEIVILPSGEVDKATIVKTSGFLPYDVAALDTVFSSAPYGRPPRAIRSADGKVYLHWRFHRNHRQCGTFGLDPFILTTPPAGPIDGDMSEVASSGGGERRGVRRLNRPRGSGGAASRSSAPRAAAEKSPGRAAAAAARAAAAKLVAADDPGARGVLRRFLEGLRAGDAQAMAAACTFPFVAQGREVATTRADLERMFGDLVRENGARMTSQVEVMTAMQARRRLGRLPPGATDGSGVLVAQATIGSAPLTLLLQQRAGRWGVVGLNR